MIRNATFPIITLIDNISNTVNKENMYTPKHILPVMLYIISISNFHAPVNIVTFLR